MRRSKYAVRGRYRWNPDTERMEQVIEKPRRHESAYVQPDIPEYVSPATGRLVLGRKARRDDLKRSNCRPYEGLEVERKEAEKVRAEQERKLDQRAEEIAWRSWYQAPERVRKVFRGR